MSRICNVCQTSFPLDAFHKSASHTGGFCHTCKECAKARARDSYARRGGQKAYQVRNLSAKFGVHPDAATRCAACAKPGQYGRGDLVPDHNHATGEFRDFLCTQCNTALGLLNEDPERMHALAAYILSFKSVLE